MHLSFHSCRLLCICLLSHITFVHHPICIVFMLYKNFFVFFLFLCYSLRCRHLRFIYLQQLNPLTPNDLYMSRTAPLTSKRCILYIYPTNVGTEYVKHALYSPLFSLQNAVCFIMLTCLVPVLFTFYIQVVLKLKKIIPATKG